MKEVNIGMMEVKSLWIFLCQFSFVTRAVLATDPRCIPSPCTNNGICYVDPQANAVKCKCPFGFSGHICERIDLCAGDKCQNGGTCVPVVTFSSMTYKCDCLPGFTGRNCEQPISNCHSKPCFHGVCIDLGTSYTCDCYPGYEGKHCDKVSTSCSSSPCTQVDSNAQCTEEDVGYSCKCSSYDFFGLNCESSSWKCNRQEESYCLCMVNNLPTKFYLPTPKPYVGANTRDVIAGVTGILLGWLLGTALFALYHCCCSSGYGWWSGHGGQGKKKEKPWERPSSNSSVRTVSSGLTSTSRPASVNQIHPQVHTPGAGSERRTMNIYRAGFTDDMAHTVSVRKSQLTYQSGTMDW